MLLLLSRHCPVSAKDSFHEASCSSSGTSASYPTDAYRSSGHALCRWNCSVFPVWGKLRPCTTAATEQAILLGSVLVCAPLIISYLVFSLLQFDHQSQPGRLRAFVVTFRPCDGTMGCQKAPSHSPGWWMKDSNPCWQAESCTRNLQNTTAQQPSSPCEGQSFPYVVMSGNIGAQCLTPHSVSNTLSLCK